MGVLAGEIDEGETCAQWKASVDHRSQILRVSEVFALLTADMFIDERLGRACITAKKQESHSSGLCQTNLPLGVFVFLLLSSV